MVTGGGIAEWLHCLWFNCFSLDGFQFKSHCVQIFIAYFWAPYTKSPLRFWGFLWVFMGLHGFLEVESQIFLWYPADIWLCAMATAFLHYQTTCAQLGRAVQCFPFSLWFKYFSDILQMSGQTPDVRICTMAAAFLYYRTTPAQLSQVFQCFSFHKGLFRCDFDI